MEVTTSPLFAPATPRHQPALLLYPFQTAALDAIRGRYQAGVTRQLVAMPTGSGKTVLACHIAEEFGPTVFMCHRDELVSQTVEKFSMFDPGLSVGICKAEQGRSRWELEGYDLIVASAQTLAREPRLTALKAATDGLPLLIVDEAHHSAAETWTRSIETLNPKLLVGLTATPKRGDGQGLDSLFQEIVYSIPMRQLVEIGRLARPIGVRIGTSVSLDSVHTRGGEFVENELAAVVNSATRNALVVSAWETHVRDTGRKRSIAFCVDVAHARALTETFRARGVNAAYVIGSTPMDERKAIYQGFRKGDIPVLVSVMVLTEGFDEPLVDAALMCRPTQSQALYIQMAGRALRHAPGKSDALILDFVDVTSRHSLQTILTLAGDEAPEEAEGDLFENVEKAEESRAAAQERKARVKRGSELLGDLLGVAPIVWQEADGKWFSALGDRSWVSVLPTADGFLPVRISEFGYDLLFPRALDAETAMNVAQRAVPLTHLTARDAGWRSVQVPATEGQRRAAAAARVTLPPGCTKGEAAELIDRGFFLRTFRKSKAHELEDK